MIPILQKRWWKAALAAVNDAFGVSHRAHASVVGVGKLLPMVSGLLLKKEIDFLDGVIENPKRPFAAIIGGAKISDKIQVIANLMEKADVIMIGGGMANTLSRRKEAMTWAGLCRIKIALNWHAT